jgi:hypothetical protein
MAPCLTLATPWVFLLSETPLSVGSPLGEVRIAVYGILS